jgi:hypothetical protein
VPRTETEKPIALVAKLDAPTLIEVVRRLLGVGVPPTAIANAFEIEAGPIKEVARMVRREAYGTDELAEAHAFLTWAAYEEMLSLLRSGSPEMRAKVAMQLQSKAMSVSARQTPEEVSMARAALGDLISDIEITDEELEAAAQEYEDARAAFVVSDEVD